MRNGFVKRMGANANGCPAEIVFAHVDGVEGAVPGLLTIAQDFIIRDRVVVQRIFGNEVLRVDVVYDALVIFVVTLGHKKHKVAGFRVFGKG